MYIVYLLIILLMVLLFILVKDKISILKIIGITLISSGVLTTLLAVAIKVLIKTTIYYINLSKVTSIILSNFIIISTIFILSGLVIGGLLGEVANKSGGLWWLSYGQSFGLSTPVQLDLSVISITFGLMFKINIASIIGMAISIFIYRKV